MKSYALLSLTVSTFAVLSGCASTPDPAVVCSAEWIAPRSESAIKRIEKRAKSSMRALTKASKTRAAGKSPGLLQVIELSYAIKKLESELKHGQGIKDLKTVAKTCNNPEIIGNAMRSLLKRQGVSDSFMTQIEDNPIYQTVISSLTEPKPVIVNR